MFKVLHDLGLQRRIMVYVAAGCLGMTGVFWLVSYGVLKDSIALVAQEKLNSVQVAAAEVGTVLAEAGSVLEEDPAAGASRVLDVLTRVSAASGGSEHLLWVAGNGRILASTAPVPDTLHQEHVAVLAPFLSRRAPGVVEHRHSENYVHLVRYAPLPGTEGGIIAYRWEDQAPVLPRALYLRVTLVALVTLAAGLFFAWVTTRQVVRPLEELTAISQRIAHGDLDTPVPVSGRDETARLAASFEQMRQELRAARAELEERVKSRTSDLEQAHRERGLLLEQVIHAHEDERVRVARELHDSLGQSLTAIVMRAGGAESLAAGCRCPEGSKLRKQLADLQELAGLVVHDVRRLIANLRPSMLDDMGLVAALDWYARDFLGAAGVAVDLQLEPLEGRLPRATETAVFRVMQEALHNVVKHARARRVRVWLGLLPGDVLTGEVADDGQGFAAVAGGNSVGLLGMRERITLLGGTLEVHSEPGHGTRVAFQIPIRGAISA